MKNSFMSNVYLLMALGLFITGLTGSIIGNDPEFITYIIDKDGWTGLGWTALLAPLLLVFLIPLVIHRLGVFYGILLFMLFAILEGLSMSVIFLVYTKSSILLTFGITGLTFLTMSVIGYITKVDLTRFGSILTMALIGLVISGLINLFIGSELISYIISGVAVLVFTGLIAYDTQKLKDLSNKIRDRDELMMYSVMGALSLYLDFLGLFLHLLKFIGDKKD